MINFWNFLPGKKWPVIHVTDKVTLETTFLNLQNTEYDKAVLILDESTGYALVTVKRTSTYQDEQVILNTLIGKYNTTVNIKNLKVGHTAVLAIKKSKKKYIKIYNGKIFLQFFIHVFDENNNLIEIYNEASGYKNGLQIAMKIDNSNPVPIDVYRRSMDQMVSVVNNVLNMNRVYVFNLNDGNEFDVRTYVDDDPKWPYFLLLGLGVLLLALAMAFIIYIENKNVYYPPYPYYGGFPDYSFEPRY